MNQITGKTLRQMEEMASTHGGYLRIFWY